MEISLTDERRNVLKIQVDFGLNNERGKGC